MLKKIAIGCCFWVMTSVSAQAITWSPAGAGAQYIPLVDVMMNGPFGFQPFNNTAISEVVAASPGKEFLDMKGNQTRTGFVFDPATGQMGAGTVTSFNQSRMYSAKGKLLFNELPLKLTFAFPANSATGGFVNDFGGGIADVAGVKYVVSSTWADLSIAPVAPPWNYIPLVEAWIQVSNLTTGKRVKVLRFKTTAKSFWQLVSVEVNDVNADGNDELVTRYQHVNANGSTRMFTIVRNLLTGKPIKGGYSIYTL